MKRMLWIILALGLLLTLCCGAAVADGAEYDIWVLGVQVTDANRNNILNDEGTAQYDPATNTLTLNNPEIINNLYDYIIYTEQDFLTISGVGTHEVSHNYGFKSKSGTLQLDGTFKYNLWHGIEAKNVIVRSGTLEVTGSIIAPISAESMIVKENITRIVLGVYTPDMVHPDKHDPLEGIGSLVLEGNIGFFPLYQEYQVVLEPGYEKNRPFVLWLGSTNVNADNCQDIFGDGKARYDQATHTLTLNGDPVISGNYTDGNGVSAKIYTHDPITIHGSYHMNSADGSQFGIYTDKHLTLEGDFKFIGTEAGVYAAGLTVKENSALVEMQGGQAGVSLTNSDCTLEGTLGLSQPLHAEFREINGRWSYADGNGAAAAIVKIEPGYALFPIWLGSTRVTGSNYQDILGDGKAGYDPATHTLTLQNGVNIQGIHTNVKSYTSKIYAVDTPLSITGSYTMNEAEAQFGVMVENGTLNLGGSLTFRGTVDGAFAGSNPSYGPEIFSPNPQDDVKLTGNITLVGGRCGLKAEGSAELNGVITLSGDQCGLAVARKLTISSGNVIISGQRGVYNESEGFEMSGGKATITASKYTGLDANGGFTVNGGELTVTANDGYAGIAVNTDAYIIGGSVMAVSHGSYASSCGLVCKGILYVSGAAKRLVLEGGHAGLEAEGLVISNTGSQNIQIVEPVGGFFFEDFNGIAEYVNSTTIKRAKHVLIDQTYRLGLGITRVYYGNKDDIFGDGKASFNPDTNVLTLNDPDIIGSGTDSSGIKMKIFADGIPLTIRGSYSMTETDITNGLVVLNAPLTLDGNFTFRGTVDGIIAGEGLTVSGGNVHAKGGDTAGVLVLNGDLTLAGGSFMASSDNRGVNVNRGKLIIGTGIDTAFFQGVSYAAIVAQEGIALPGSDTSQVKLVYPGRGYVWEQTVYDPDYVPTDVGPVYVSTSSGGDYPAHSAYFESERLYGLTLGSVQVTSSNAADILGDGKASYDPVTKTLTLDEPVISGSTVDSSNGFAASNTILANNIDRLTIKGKWHMSYPADNYAIQVTGGSLVLDGSFGVGGTIAGISARDEIVVQSGSLYALGGEIGAVSSRLVIVDGCGYVELVSGSQEPCLFDQMPEAPASYLSSEEYVGFLPSQAISTAHYQMSDVVLVRKFNSSGSAGNWMQQVGSIKITGLTGFEGAGSEGDPYQIKTAEHWNRLAQKVEDGTDLSRKHFALMNDLTVTTMIGSSAHPFSGIFDGGGHTLTFSAAADADNCAPFQYVGTGTIKNLRIAGQISTSKKCAAGLVGTVTGSCRIVNCVSSIRILSATNGDGTHGGFVGAGANVSFTGCLFNGTISGANTTKCAGFLGWDNGGSSVSWCVYDGTMDTGSESATFIRNVEAAPNCYYVSPVGQGLDRGKSAHTVSTSSTAITLDYGGGVPYNVSGITAYPAGLKREGQFYAGASDLVSMRIVYGDAPMGTRFDGVGADGGELTESENEVWILTMPDSDVYVYPLTVLEYGSGTEEDPWLISGNFPFSDLSAGWYRVSVNSYFLRSITVSGTVHLHLGAGTTLTATQGINVSSGNSLIIDGTGTLNATGSEGCAGIGGGIGESCGTVTINSGTVNATGSVWGAGIGGGKGGGNGGNITINGGTVTAQCYDPDNALVGLAAGIGGGDTGSGGNILITGGTVYARGNRGSAGIGGGGYGSGGTITITGGHVTAIGASYPNGRSGAGIGAGRVRNNATSGDSGNITISGGTVIAIGGNNAQAIGISNEVASNDSGTLTLGSGLMVKAGGSESTAVIASGDLVAACRSAWAMISSNLPFDTPDFTLPAALNVIEESAFEGLTAMTVVDASHCTTVGKWAFKGCTGLTMIRLSKDCAIDAEAFTGCGTVYIFAPAGGSTEAYCNAHENCVFVEE